MLLIQVVVCLSSYFLTTPAVHIGLDRSNTPGDSATRIVRARGVVVVTSAHEIRATALGPESAPVWRMHGTYLTKPAVVNGGRRLVILNRDKGELLDVTSRGRVVWRFSDPDTDMFVASQHMVIATSHSGNYHRRDLDTLEGIRLYWKVRGFSQRWGSARWCRSVAEVGEPIALSCGERLWTIRLVNPAHYYTCTASPVYMLELRRADTGRLLQAWRLPAISSTFGDWPTLVHCLATSVGAMTQLRISEGPPGDFTKDYPGGTSVQFVFDSRKHSLTRTTGTGTAKEFPRRRHHWERDEERRFLGAMTETLSGARVVSGLVQRCR